MATIRHHTRLERSPDAVWAVVSDAGTIAEWFPVIDESRAEGGIRSCTLQGGGKLEEEIVIADGLDGLNAHLEG